eukprot:24386-Prymnesium_polylepis.2
MYVCTMASLLKALHKAIFEKVKYAENKYYSQTAEEIAQICREAAPVAENKLAFLQDFLEWYQHKPLDNWARGVQTHFLRAKRSLQAPPYLDERKPLRDVFERYFPGKPKGNFILDGCKKRKLEEMVNDE